MSKLITDTIRHTGSSADNITLDGSQNTTIEGNLTVDGTTTLTGAVTLPAGTTSDTLSFRNLIINGAMNVAQRGTSSTTSGSFTADRFKVSWGGLDEAITYSQHALTSSDTGPWAKGFRSSLHLQNGDQTSGFGAADVFKIQYIIEAQDIAKTGWDYTSASSDITLSFWVKSSVAQNFYGYLKSLDGTFQHYAYETGSLTADTWTKITKTITGQPNITFDDNNNSGLVLELIHFTGTDESASSVTLNQWGAFIGTARTPDNTTTWYTTDNATLEITGVQFEPGSTATAFEHRSYGDELARCQRYYIRLTRGGGDEMHFPGCTKQQQYVCAGRVSLPTTMRTNPSISFTGTRDIAHYSNDNSGYSGDRIEPDAFSIRWGSSNTITDGAAYTALLTGTPNYVECSAEL